MSRIPDFTQVEFADVGARRLLAPGAPWLTPEGIAVKAVYGAGRSRGPRLPRHLSRHRALSARPLPDHVRHPAVDHPAICRLLHRRGFQRLLPAQSRRRAEGPLGRLRSRHPSRLRLRSSARRRRRRHGRRRDRFDLRHAHAVLRHPARPDDRVDDHERRGAAGAWRSTSSPPRSRACRRKSSPARSRTTSSKNSWCATPTSIRRSRRCASSPTSSPTPRRTCRSSTRSRSPAITCRRPARRPTSSSPIRSPTASNMCAPGSRPGSTSTASRRACRSSWASA